MVLVSRYRFLSLRHVLVFAGVIAAGWAGAQAPKIANPPVPDAPRSPDSTALRRDALPGPYPAEIIRVLDGDTFEARVRVWFGQEITTLVRIRGMDAPELKGLCGDELKGAIGARDALAKLLASGLPLLRDVSLDKYAGRVVASVNVRGAGAIAEDVTAWMIASGWARPYTGGRRDAWCPLRVGGRG